MMGSVGRWGGLEKMMRTSLRAGIGPVREAKIVPPASCSPMRTEKTALILPAWPEKKRITAERDRDKEARERERERARGFAWQGWIGVGTKGKPCTVLNELVTVPRSKARLN